MNSQIKNIDAEPICQDISIKEGTTGTLDTTLKYPDPNDLSVRIAADLTAATATLTVKDSEDATILQKINTPGNHEAPLEGRTQFVIDKTDTAGLLTSPQTSIPYKYEVRRTAAGGEEYVHLEGNFIILEAVGT